MIELRNVSIAAGGFLLQNLSLQIDRGEYAVLMGQTGQGKTTILEAVCGLRRVVSGVVIVDGTDVTEWSPGDRGIGYVPQDLALFPTLSVRQHLEFALRLRHWLRSHIVERVTELAEVLGIPHLLDRSVHGLSGGESQRVALGRALSFRPHVLLLDEPFSALDEATREEMYVLMKTVAAATGVTTLHVTHSRDEAQTLATCRLWLKSGSIRRHQDDE